MSETEAKPVYASVGGKRVKIGTGREVAEGVHALDLDPAKVTDKAELENVGFTQALSK